MHDCCLCGCACYCHGDIDDCPVETIEYAYEHCEGCGCEEDRHEFDDDDCEYTPGMNDDPGMVDPMDPNAREGLRKGRYE